MRTYQRQRPFLSDTFAERGARAALCVCGGGGGGEGSTMYRQHVIEVMPIFPSAAHHDPYTDSNRCHCNKNLPQCVATNSGRCECKFSCLHTKYQRTLVSSSNAHPMRTASSYQTTALYQTSKTTEMPNRTCCQKNDHWAMKNDYGLSDDDWHGRRHRTNRTGQRSWDVDDQPRV
jgi:hypothetical protein